MKHMNERKDKNSEGNLHNDVVTVNACCVFAADSNRSVPINTLSHLSFVLSRVMDLSSYT